ncbi:MAG TPA: GNAT family N-acetyltransferase [Rhodanobacteraceae bacterium]|nr:GNAT family N-acetyltransferase [Rhodanobacteraceae bacterium]
MSFTIAAAEERDIGEIADLFRAYEAHIGVDLSYQGFASELATLPGKYAPPHGQLLIARNANGAAIGCVALRPVDAPGCCEMKRLFVSTQGRGFGLGRALTEAIIAQASKLGYAELRLDTLPTMHEAIALYRKLGFVPIEPYYPAREGTLFMALSLRA